MALMWGLDDNSMDSMSIYYYSLFHSIHFLVDFPILSILYDSPRGLLDEPKRLENILDSCFKQYR